MENNERDRKLDQWLDEALSQYSAAEPRIGLEQRVLAHVRAEQKAGAARRGWWHWMPAFAAVAAVLIVAAAVRPYWDSQHSEKSAEVAGSLRVQSKDKALANADTKATPEQQAVAAGTPVTGRASVPRREPTATADTAAEVKEIAPAKDQRREAAEEANLYKAPVEDSVASRSGHVAGGVAGGVVGGIVSNAPVLAEAPAAAPPDAGTGASGGVQNVQVESAAAAIESQNTITTERVAEWPKASKKVDALAGKMKTQPVKTEADGGAVNVMGVMLRVNSTVSTGQQFPTPTPLSKQERLAMAVSHAIGDKSSSEAITAKSNEELKPVEIKRIEIAPLPGPEKEK